MYIRKEARNERVRSDARELPNVVELGEMPAPVRELFARFPAIEDRHPCAVFFNGMARCFGRHLDAAERSSAYRELTDPETMDAANYFQKEFPRHSIERHAEGKPAKRFDHYNRYILAFQEVRRLVAEKKLPTEATARFVDAAHTVIDAIRRAELP